MTSISGVQKVDVAGRDLWSTNSQAQAKFAREDNQGAVSHNSGEAKPKFDISKLEEEDKKKLEEQLKKINDSLVSFGKMLKFKFDEAAQTTYVEVIDAETQEVIASMPPEFLIDLSVKMKELIGMFLDKRL